MDSKNEPDLPVPIRPLLLKFITDEKKKNNLNGHYTAVGSINPEFVKTASPGELNSACLKLVGDGRFFKILYPPGWLGPRPMELMDIYLFKSGDEVSNQDKWQISRCDECECAWWVTPIGEQRFCADCLKEALLGGEEYLDKFSNGRWVKTEGADHENG